MREGKWKIRLITILTFLLMCISILPQKAASMPGPVLYFQLDLTPGPDDKALKLFDESGSHVGSWKAGSGLNSDPIECPKRNVGPIPPGIWRLGNAGVVNGKRGYRLNPVAHPPYYRDWDTFWIHEDDDCITHGCIGLLYEDWDNFDDTLRSQLDWENTILVADYNIFDVSIYPSAIGGLTIDSDPTVYPTPWDSWGSTYNRSFTGQHSFTLPEYVMGMRFIKWTVTEFNVKQNKIQEWESKNRQLILESKGSYRRYYCFASYGYPRVGGIVIPVDKFALLAPYIGLASTIIVTAVATVIYVKRVKHRKEKQ
jgi:hypothetical protein